MGTEGGLWRPGSPVYLLLHPLLHRRARILSICLLGCCAVEKSFLTISPPTIAFLHRGFPKVLHSKKEQTRIFLKYLM
jgi:hypothetical protein